jgi:hypothetical protein
MPPHHGTAVARLVMVLALTAPTAAQQAHRASPLPGGVVPIPALAGEVVANRVQYGVRNDGQIGVDPINSTSITVAFWPRGTGNQYMFNSGFQVSGIIAGNRPANPWAGDTTGALFFDASGLRSHGTPITSLANAAIPEHLAAWPQAAYTPHGSEGALFADVLRGRASASEADVWWLTWDGDPALNAARPHPLGILAEHRVMGWNAPRGNEDILYVMVTFYNITSRNPTDYAQYRPGLREMLTEQGARFHQLNEQQFAIDLPDAGYTIDPFYASFAADPDVTTSAGINFASVNLPLAMSMAWHRDLPRATGWIFPADLYSAPFFAGAGFVGMKYLRTLDGGPRIHLYSNHTGGGAFPDPNSAVRAFKYMSASITPADGVACNMGDPLVSHMCYVGDAVASDVRLMQSSPAVALAPGASATLVFAYVHAAPVLLPSWTPASDLMPGDPRRLTSVTQLAVGANQVDSVAGFTGFSDDNGNGQVEGHELRAVPRSLIAKAQLAQAFFAHGFTAPVAPEAPDFFLVPGDGVVTVAWRPSRTEEVGDPYFAVASQAMVVPSGGGAPVPNPMFDPNYRQFDVEGYRIWRGRTDAPEALQLVAQFNHRGTTFRDYTGQVNDQLPDFNRCAPELGVTTDCAGVFDTPMPGVPPIRFREFEIFGQVLQVASGDRLVLPNGEVELLAVDTARMYPDELHLADDGGVPFVWRDSTVRNNLTYFYAVTAFDVNAINSTGAGRTSLESPRITRRVTPVSAAFNIQRSVATETFLRGRGVVLTDQELPTIDPVGRLSKRFPITTAVTFEPLTVVAELLAGTTEAVLRLDSTTIIEATDARTRALQHFTLTSGTGSTSQVAIPVEQNSQQIGTTASRMIPILQADPERAAAHLGAAGVAGNAMLQVEWPGLYYTTIHGRGCVNGLTGSYPEFGNARACSYNGPRWFNGASETQAHPNAGNAAVFNLGSTPTQFNNAGALEGVRTIFHPQAYEMTPTAWRRVETLLGAFASGADYRVHWGAGGVIDSVVDLTYHVQVPFRSTMGLSWGVLNADAVPGFAGYDQRDALTYTDANCVAPLRQFTSGTTGAPCGGPAVPLESRVRLGPVVFAGGSSFASNRSNPVAPGQGFLLYLKGRLFLIEMTGGLPGAATTWTMRDYVGAISGGMGQAGNFGAYQYRPPESGRFPLTAAGVELVMRVHAEEVRGIPTAADLAAVHTVPDPYYRRVDPGAGDEGIAFVNLPDRATIRIYSGSGVLIRVLDHGAELGEGETRWDLRSRSGRGVASGVYFYHVSAPGGATAVGRMAVVR